MDRRVMIRRETVVQTILVAISGLLMWLAFPDFGWWPALFVSLLLLLAVVRSVGVRRGAWLSALWAMVFFLPHISWMNVATNQTYLAWILLAVAQAFFLGLWGAMYAATNEWRWARQWWAEPFVAALLWVGIEQLRARVPLGGFPWAKLPYALIDTPLTHLAPRGGEVLVSSVAIAVVVLAMHAALPVRTGTAGIEWRRRSALAVGALLLFAVPALFPMRTVPEAGTLRVLAVQGNVEIPMQDSYAVEGQVTENHVRESLVGLESGSEFDVILWGEDSVDRDPADSEVTNALLQEILKESKLPVVAGYQEFRGDVRRNWYGSWHSDGTIQEFRYGKQHPVPWGEYVPWRSLSEFLAVEAAGISTDMVPVDNPALLVVELADGREIPFAVGICFEAGDEQILAEGVQLGGQAVLIPTNNSHFRDSAESTQQLQMTRFRAAEFSRAALQISTNGVSAVIAPDGRIVEQTAKQQPGHIATEIPLRTSLTTAAKLGVRLPLEAIAASLILGSAALLSRLSRLVRQRRS